jgi:DNA invertase Pin-like site-specific DNA recombinase
VPDEPSREPDKETPRVQRRVSSTKAKRPALDSMMRDARRGEFSVLLVAAFDRVARSVREFLQIVNELHELGIEFISARESLDTGGPMGRMFVTMVGSIAELERSLIVERIKAGMRRARLEGQRLGRARSTSTAKPLSATG